MNVSRKLFLTITAFIVTMGVLFVLLTHFVVKEALEVGVQDTRGEEITELSNVFIDYYKKNDHSWEGVQQAVDLGPTFSSDEATVLLKSPNRQLLYAAGDTAERLVERLGIETSVQIDGETIAFLYYYDQEVSTLSKLRIGIPISVSFLLSASAVVFVIISLIIAYWLSKRLTMPLSQLIPVIDRLGKGELGVQAPVVTKDEYGKVAIAFNEMSSQLEHAEKMRRNLTADIAHELRTPLTIVSGKLDFIQQSGQIIKPETLLPLQDELIRLNRLVNDLHVLSLAEAKKLPLSPEPTDMLALLRHIVEHITLLANDKGITVTLTCHADETTVHVDPNRMTQVFLNLLTNAIRYTPVDGSVDVAISQQADQHTNSMLTITIKDTGIGIEPEHLPHLFDRFYRTDRTRTRNSGGTGLGLAIAKQYVLAHNGTIDVDSTPGHGTRFIVKLPL